MVGVLGSLQEAEQAVQALVDAGYHVENMALIQSHDFPSALQERWRKKGRLGQMLYQLEVTTDEGSLVELLEAAARPGSAILTLYVPHREHLASVSALLFNHGAHLVKYVGTWSVEDLFPPLQEEHVSAKATAGVGDEAESDNQQPGQARQPTASTRVQDWGSEQAIRIAASSANGVAEKQGQLRALPERSRRQLSEFIQGSSQHPQQANTAQDLGQPGVAAPPLGLDPGSA